jgi:hypothetical protein
MGKITNTRVLFLVAIILTVLGLNIYNIFWN